MMRASLDELNRMDEPAFVAAIGDVFEHAPWVALIAHGARPFPSLNELYETMVAAVRGAGDERQIALIRGHPDLAGTAAREDTLTADSKIEQASAGLNHLSENELESLNRLNNAYRAKFDMPFIICVRRHGKESILRQFEKRLNNNGATEREVALNEVFRIVALRLDQRVAALDRLDVHGHLSTHVIDTHRGRPASGVPIEFFEIVSSGESRLVCRTTTSADGRTDRPLIAEQPIPIAQYELRFDLGDYFSQQGTPLADPPFLGVVPVRFAIAEPEARYHVPILVTPWSYSTYRGN
jgi:2-oxo-4-hydroxy-4-carboxy-5-ureidoimidazoline decarboxylase